MSNYGSAPPPGSYAQPNQTASTQGYNAQQQQGYQQPQTSPYQPSTTNHANPSHGSKVPGGAFGQMMNQAVTTGKPMLDKLSKTISSKLGNKPPPGPPQHLQSYQNYQTHQGQQNAPQGPQLPQVQSYGSQTQPQQQWQQPQQPPSHPQPQPSNTNVYASAQHSPYQQSTYATPLSGYSSGPSNYFPQQGMQPPQAPTPLIQPQNTPGLTQGEQLVMNQQTAPPQGQYSHAQGLYQNYPYQQDHFGGQQMGVVGNAQSSGHPQISQAPYNSANQLPPVSPLTSNQPLAQSQWESSTAQAPHTSVQQQPSPLDSPRPYQSVLTASGQQGTQQQWQPLPAHRPQGQAPTGSAASPPAQQGNAQPQIPPNKPMQSQLPTPISQYTAHPPTSFAAELPADLGNLQLTESRTGHGTPTQSPQYQAYNAPTGTPSSGHRIPRRAVSTSGQPLADPWRFIDPVTELPTREFYILADLVFDALDRKFGPQNSGLLEGPKALASWVGLSEDAHAVFAYNNYATLAKLWSLEGIPHLMVPMQAHLAPLWNFDQHAHAQHLKLIAEPATPATPYASYVPALNRAGWYKFFFLQMAHTPRDIEKVMLPLCADTYRPGVLNHPDLNKRDGSVNSGLEARAGDIQMIASKRVVDEARSAVMPEQNRAATSLAAPSSQVLGSTPHGPSEEEALMLLRIQMQANDAAVRSVVDGDIMYKQAGSDPGGFGRLV